MSGGILVKVDLEFSGPFLGRASQTIWLADAGYMTWNNFNQGQLSIIFP